MIWGGDIEMNLLFHTGPGESGRTIKKRVPGKRHNPSVYGKDWGGRIQVF